MGDIIKPPVLVIEGILKDVMKKAIVTSSTQDKDTANGNALTVPPATDVARKSKSDIFENTGELCSEKSYSSNHRDQSEYLKLEKDYSHRPRVPGMDWAECPWAHPDDSLFPSSDDNVKP